MIFAKRYESLILHGEDHELRDDICGEVDFKIRQKFVAIMVKYNEPITLHPERYDYNNTVNTDAFTYACEQFNEIMDVPYIRLTDYWLDNQYSDSFCLENWCMAFIFSVAELQYLNLSDNEKSEYSATLNNFFEEYNLPWKMFDGKMLKIDAKQFECDLKAKAIAQMQELKDAEHKFQSAYNELTTAVEALETGNYQSAISNAEKSYESVLKVILGVDDGNANQLTQAYRDKLLKVPATMQTGGFESQVMKSLPFIRNNSGADHGAGAKEVVISKPMAKLAVNLAAALDTYLIEEYLTCDKETE